MARLLFVLSWWISLTSSLADNTAVDATSVHAATAEASLEQKETTDGSSSVNDNAINYGPSLIEFVRKNGGYVHPHYDIRQADDGTSRFAVFAKDDIPEDELLLRIPRSCLVATDDDDICDTVDLLVQEMHLGNESYFEPYVTYLNSQTPGQLPTMWTTKGVEFLNKLLGHGALPPAHATDVDWGCHDASAPMEQQHAAMLLIQRGWDEVLIPVYDMMSHRNGEQWLNTRLAKDSSVHDKTEDVHVYTSRKIYKNEEVYTTYDQCEDCGGRSNAYGTAEIVRDYGFVELIPQKWVFPKQRVTFGLDYQYDETGQVLNDEELVLTWYSAPSAAARALHFFEQQITRLEQFGTSEFSKYMGAIPSHEYELVEQYHLALLRAMRLVVKEVKGSREEVEQAVVKKDEESNKDHGQRQMEWVRSKGGFVTSKMEIRKLAPDDPNSVYGMFATQDMKQGDVLLSIPRDCLLTTFEDDPCDTVDLLAQEMVLGEKSGYEPYITYLKETQPFGQLPALWSEPGKELLLRLVMDIKAEIDEEEEEESGQHYQALPPYGLIIPEYIGCADFGSQSPLVERHAAMLVHQRGWDETLIPVYDMMSHRNGERWLNTRESHSVHDQNRPVQVEASRDIKQGEEIYTSYDSCLDCGGRSNDYGTAQIFRDYGFVEGMPQKWVFEDRDLTFTLDYKYDESNAVEDYSDLEVKLVSGDFLDEDTLDFLHDQIDRLTLMKETELVRNDANIPDQEWNTILQYNEAILTAMSKAVEALGEETKCFGEDGDVSNCQVSDSRYNLLDAMFDEEGYNKYVCDIDWSFPGYEPLETIHSKYQKIHFIKEPKNQDVCFELDGTWQVCGSYRPHYHEMATHYAASFLPEIKRVLWVGGGDSMLLHEIIKYPSLELAVGLELDQKVTRGSFKHFGTQPHWDNEKVEWYFGDAAKSLLMLPRDYFGSFDLVLVDLSETVMSLSVTEGLDIMDALSLLLKPEGILLKNEIYFEQLNKIFKHSIQLHVYDVPVLCSQSFIFGSNKIDFLKQPLTSHNMSGDNLFFKPPSTLDYRYFEIHDYAMNPHPQHHCTENSEVVERLPESQDRSPGILMILEAENANPALLTGSGLLDAVKTAVNQENLSIVSSLLPKGDGSETMVAVVLREGYIIARTWAEQKYCAFDVYMWGSFFKIGSLKHALISAVQSDSKSTSSFKIVAGGMFGVGTWKEDSLKRGPTLDKCETTQSEVRDVPMAIEVVKAVVKDNLDLLPTSEAVVVVLCGSTDACESIESASNHDSVGRVLALRPCASIEGSIEYQPDSGTRKFSCEQEILSRLQEVNDNNETVDALLLDPSADFAMAQIVYKICSRTRNKRMFFSESLLVLAPMIDPTELWRRVFVDKFREIFNVEPLFRSQVVFNTSDSSMEMGAFLAGDERYIENVMKVTEKIESRGLGLIGETRGFEAGRFPTVPNPDPTLFTLPGHYDQRGPFEQWKSQRPLGRQTVIQMEVEESKKEHSALSKEKVQSFVDGAISGLKLEPLLVLSEKFEDLGEGCAIFSIWKGGSVVILWDGRDNITINLFSYDQDSEAFATNFALQFRRISGSLQVMLRDEMPRGYGRVVNFDKDIESMGDKDPHWALGMN